MSRLIDGFVSGIKSFPRVSGDEPRRFLIVEVAEKFSPRERG